MVSNDVASRSSPRVVNDTGRQLFTYSDYTKDDLKLTYVIDQQRGTMDIQHTYVPASMQGQGVAKRLAQAAFEYAKVRLRARMSSRGYLYWHTLGSSVGGALRKCDGLLTIAYSVVCCTLRSAHTKNSSCKTRSSG